MSDDSELEELAKTLRGPSGEGSMPWELVSDVYLASARRVLDAGYVKLEPITDKDIENAAKDAWIADQDDEKWARSVVDDVFSPADDWPDEAMRFLTIAQAILGVTKP